MHACLPGPAVPLSRPAAPRVGSACLPDASRRPSTRASTAGLVYRIASTVGIHEADSGRASLPRSARLLKPTEFKRIFGKNVASADRFFRVIARPAAGDSSRLGMAVSRKVDKRAVARNRIKRIIRERFRMWRARNAERNVPSLDIVVLARPASATICREQLHKSLERHWSAIERGVEQKFRVNRQPEEQERWEI